MAEIKEIMIEVWPELQQWRISKHNKFKCCQLNEYWEDGIAENIQNENDKTKHLNLNI